MGNFKKQIEAQMYFNSMGKDGIFNKYLALIDVVG